MTYNDGGTNKTLTQTAVYDAWGQMTSSVDANGAQTNFTYNNMGRMITRANPFALGGTPGPVTTYAYDLLGRNTVVTLPGGNTVQTTYTNSAIVTVTDQVNRKIKRETDGLGRLIKVTEQDVATGALTQETSYTYDLADRLIGVNQGNQTRTFRYDSEGKLLFERIPEQTATINDGSGTFWTSKYTYTDWGAVATKQDARGVITTYGYDTLHRLISLSYNTVSGVTTAPTVSYNYDNTVGSATKGLLLSLTVGSGYSETYSYGVGYGNGGNGGNKLSLASVNRVIDGRSYVTGYQYNAANQLTQTTYPSGRVIGLGHDNKGRVTSVGSFLSSVTYNAIGQLTGTTLGNGVTEGYGYDANRMQLTSQTATQSGGPANGLMNLTYGYQASAGQMGAGTTAGNAGQLMSISGTIGGVTESAAYTYDDLGRLVTSNQTSNTSSAQRRFAYDRWGNRTGMWDATSGGNQIQSITLQQSGGAPTNRITSVTTGSTVNYSYDAAGNVTNDGVHSYGYDSENRIVSVDGGSTASYAYDQQNRRYKKTVASSVTHCVWEGSQVIAEHNSTGAVLIDYIYSGRRMIAKVESGSTQYFLSDRLSSRLSLDQSGNVIGRQGHLPFGEDFGESGTQEKHHFTSYQRDGESGIDYAINRGYSAAVGKFLSADPYQASGFMVVPQSWNRFSYNLSDPVNLFDTLGLGGTPVQGGSLGSVTIYGGGGIVIDPAVTGNSHGLPVLNDPKRYPKGDGPLDPDQGTPRAPLLGDGAEKAQKAVEDGKDMLDDPECDHALADYGIPSIKALVNGMTGVGINANVFDGRYSAQRITIDPSRGTTVEVRNYWIRNPDTNAVTIPGAKGAVFLGPNWFNDNPAGRARTMIHEGIHLIGGKRDSDFDRDHGDQDTGSNNLRRILAEKCKSK